MAEFALGLTITSIFVTAGVAVIYYLTEEEEKKASEYTTIIQTYKTPEEYKTKTEVAIAKDLAKQTWEKCTIQ